jgi:hypothetical protein
VPSAEVLDRIARALALSPVEREHLFLLAQNRPPEVRHEPAERVTPRLQRVLDSLELSPALVKTSTWDIIAWNRAASAVLVDYDSLSPKERNVVRLIFWLEYSAFSVDGQPDLAMVIYSPATPADADRIRALLHAKNPSVS